jgi:hypothetical protein
MYPYNHARYVEQVNKFMAQQDHLVAIKTRMFVESKRMTVSGTVKTYLEPIELNHGIKTH